MAAIVRSGARRLIQRAPAAGALPQRPQAPCLARFMSSTEKRARREPPESLSKALDEIQVLKEELYDLIAKSEPTDRQNRQLLRTLSRQIKPRPHDKQWRKTRAVEVVQDVVKSCIPFNATLLAGFTALEVHVIRKNREEEKEFAAAAAAAAGQDQGDVAHA